jgi:Tfp pilus assembly protein PilE
VTASDGEQGTMHMMRNERGLTIIGFVFVAAIVVIFALVGFRVLPAYVEYFQVQKALQGALEDSETANLAEVRRNFDRRISASYVDSVRPTDVTVSRQGNQIVASIVWQRILPMIGNASILLDFDATATK